MTPTNPDAARLVFMGSPAFALPSLRGLVEGGFRVVGVYTQPDSPVGRGRLPQPTSVKRVAEQHGLPIYQPARLRGPDVIAALRGLRPDLLIVAAYGEILSTAVLAIPPCGGLNVHASLLPRYRGASPVAGALLDGATETGVSIMRIDQGLDTGPVLAQRRAPVDPLDTAGSLTERLAVLGAELLLEVLPLWLRGDLQPWPQDPDAATVTRRIRKEDGRIDWRLPAMELARRVRAYTPWPGATTSLDGVLVRILQAWPIASPSNAPSFKRDEPKRDEPAIEAGEPGSIRRFSGPAVLPDGLPRPAIAVQTGTGLLLPLRLQKAGKRPLTAVEFLNGEHGLLGKRFGG